MNLTIAQEDMEVLKMKNKNKAPEFIQPNELTTEQKASMKTRIISGIVAGFISIPLLVLGDFFFFAFVLFLLCCGTYEIIHCAKRKYCVALYIVAFILAALMTFWPLIAALPNMIRSDFDSSWRIFNYFSSINISIAIIALGVLGIFAMVFIDKGFTVRDGCFIFTMILIMTLAYQAGMYIRYLPSYVLRHPGFPIDNSIIVDPKLPYFNWFDNFESSALFITAIIGTIMTDIGAYFVGVFFGKHKMLERISPKKTWEGFVGGVVVSSMVTFGMSMALMATGHPLVAGILDMEHWYFALIFSFLVPLASVFGDLVFSSVKRYFGIKDFSNLIPGHGGVLDRLDSVIFTLITTGVYMYLLVYWRSFLK